VCKGSLIDRDGSASPLQNGEGYQGVPILLKEAIP
jgi:hypothetical protein